MRTYNGDFLTRAPLEALGVRCAGDDVLVHVSVVIVDPENLSLGYDVRIDPFCILTASGGIQLGNHIHVSGHCSLIGGGGIEVGDFCGLSHGARIFSVSDNVEGDYMHGPTVSDASRCPFQARVTVKRHAAICAGCVILPGVTIGEGAVVGALSLARKDIPPWQIWAGIPAHFIRNRRRALLAFEPLVEGEDSVERGS